jgi:hypothetical protein
VVGFCGPLLKSHDLGDVTEGINRLRGGNWVLDRLADGAVDALKGVDVICRCPGNFQLTFERSITA